MTDFEMDKMYTITGRELLAILSLIPDGTEKAKVIVENVASREKSRNVKECQKFEVLKPCPFCGAKAMLVYCVHGVGANWGVECTETHAHRMEFGGTQDEVIKEWNMRVKE